MSERPRMLVLARAWWPAVAYMAFIWLMSSLSHPPSVENFPLRDKGVHALEYAILCALLFHAYRGTFTRARMHSLFAYAVGSAALWGLLDEIHQAYVPNRNSDPMDLLADTVGALIGATVYFFIVRGARKPTS